MTGAPEVSVVLPVYNGERYVADAIASVLSQTFTDFELVICDDGSTDSSWSIVETFRDPRIKAFRNPQNIGLFPTLNALVAQSRAPLIRLWSQDDVMKPACLATEFDRWRQGDFAFSYCQRDTIDENGAAVEKNFVDDTPQVLEPWRAAQICFYYGCIAGNIATMMIARETFERLGGFGDFVVSGDFDFIVRSFELEKPIAFFPERLIFLRDHAGQFSQSARSALHFVRENEPIFAKLMTFFPGDLYSTMRRYHRHQRFVRYFHYAMKSILRGRAAVARELLRTIMKSESLLSVGIQWLLTMNGRYWRPPIEFRDPS